VNAPEKPEKPKEAASGPSPASPPAISLPKGGGAIRGMGEKFAANPVTGTGSMTVPIATSPGRSGFGPQLSLAYDSGAGNGPFGLGWSLSLPSITRKTDKGLPQYRDVEESDVFILSGAEDLVPVLRSNGERFADKITFPGYVIHRYRPRVEGLFARIERWTNTTTGAIHWRSITKDNVTTLYGKDNDARIFDPAEIDPTAPNSTHPTHIFSWLICQSYDDKGNAIVYQYAAEDDANVDLTQANERNRTRKANRYLKHIKYGNRTPNRDANGNATDPTLLLDATWMFEVVFDYGEGHLVAPPAQPGEHQFVTATLTLPNTAHWPARLDPFSTYRAGFEVRTYRLCRRVLLFHHFPAELSGDDCLVRSTEFTYNEGAVASFITQVTQSGYLHQPAPAEPNRYLCKTLPPLEFTYSQVPTAEELATRPIQEVDAASLENLPIGLDGAVYQWMDLDGEGLSGVLTDQGDGWFYKRNTSANNLMQENGNQRTVARFAPLELVATRPAGGLRGGQAQFMDLAGDGQLDLVVMEGPVRGFFERTPDEEWEPLRPFRSWPNVDTRDPNLKFIDLDGDGHSDILIGEHDAFTWHGSLAEDGFGPAQRTFQPWDEEKGPRLVFADGEQSIYLADLSGDGLTDLARIRNGEVCYWPNVGYGRFGAKVTMDNAPWFDQPDQFDQQRIRLADIDGSGVTDIFYVSRQGVQIFYNQSGNGWSAGVTLQNFPALANLATVQAVDLLGNGTACLVWSSPLPGDARRPMRYLDLMGEKPHLLIKTVNNLGAETVVQYAPSTRFYLQDKLDGHPWLTKLSFPVHVVERVETYDRVSGNRFVTRYQYRHGYFDGVEREFRGFGLVEQWDTEEIGSVAGDQTSSLATNLDAASFVPPVHTKTWFHTGVYLGRDHVSDFFAGLLDEHDQGEYYREPGLTDAQARDRLLPDTIVPPGLTLDEERQACRALKGAMLRQEVYGLDGTDKAQHPYTVIEQNFTIERLQPQGVNRHAVFFTHAREAISYHYERNPDDPRIQHALTLAVDEFGNVLKSLAIGYGRRTGLSPLQGADQAKQKQLLITYTESDYTKNDITTPADWVDAHRTPLPWEARTYELTGFALASNAARFAFADFAKDDFAALTSLNNIPYETPVAPAVKGKQLIECVRTLYRRNDLTALLSKGTLQSLALPGESYKLAFTPGLLNVYAAKIAAADLQPMLRDEGKYLDLDNDGHWWIPSGRVFFSPIIPNPQQAEPTATEAGQELAEAQQHFFLPRRYRDPFWNNAIADYDGPADPALPRYDSLVTRTQDPVQNVVRAEHNYRVLQPWRMTDPNGNRSEVGFDTLGMVVTTAMKGKDDSVGDTLSGFEPDLTQDQIDEFYDAEDPHVPAPNLLQGATTRIVYDLDRFRRTRQAHPQDSTQWRPIYAATLARETHVSDPLPPQGLKILISFGYSDGFGREIQKKIQAEPGPLVEGGPVISPRWVGSGWTIFNNKGKPVRQYEPFFSQLAEKRHHFEFGVQVGVSPVLFYDPVERVVATLNPNHTWEKVVFDPWQQSTYDVNDTVLNGDGSTDPKADKDVMGFFARLPNAEYLPTWYDDRIGRAVNDPERIAADKAAVHLQTPSVAHLDTFGRTFLTLAHNRFVRNNAIVEEEYATRVELDIEGNQRAVIDAKERIVMRYDYDLLGNRIHQASMEAGERWMLNEVTGKSIRAWDSRGHTFRTEYDRLRRPLRSFVLGADPTHPDQELLTERLVYGEQHPEDALHNLRGKLYLHLDQAGVVTNEANDFKGNPLQATRRLTNGAQYRQAVDWRAVDADPVAMPDDAMTKFILVALEAALAPHLEAEPFANSTSYDALNRPLTLTTPHTPTMQPSVIRLGYNAANLLERVDANLNSAAINGQPVWTSFVSNIDYDAKGQRMVIDYGNGVSTTYAYDEKTFRLTHLQTLRGIEALQDLFYTYDPASNITAIRDDAQQTIFFANQMIEPHTGYTYDAIYRLIEAAGREHLGQTNGQRNSPTAPDGFNAFHTNLPHPGDGQAMGTYSETFIYDAVGNFKEMNHRGTDPAHPGWTRSYVYNELSPLEQNTVNNRLSSTTISGTIESYTYDTHGNMTTMPHLPQMDLDFEDQLQMVDLGGGGKAYYVYDAAGQRVRKVWEKSPGLAEERIYLGGFELFRRRNGAGAITLERETLHVMDDKQHIALVETRTQGNDGSPAQLIRYQFSNHLDSASLELDDVGEIISYEEYYPFGSTSYQAVRSGVEVNPKRYRYTSKERDEETGLYYHGARYYAPWLARWMSSDPIGIEDGINAFVYVKLNPITSVDRNGTNSSPWEKVETDDTNSNYFQNTETGQVIRRYRGAVEVWDEVAPQKYKQTYAEYHFADDPLEAKPQKVQSPTETKAPAPETNLEEPQSEVDEDAGTVGKPGFAESLIPIWGSGRSAIYHAQKGEWGWAAVDTALAISDVFLMKSLVTAGGKLLVKGGAVGIGKITLEGSSKKAAVELGEKAAETTLKGALTEGALKSIRSGIALSQTQKDLLRAEARILLEQSGKSVAERAVHHRIPLEYAHLFPKLNPNVLGNLRALRSAEHIFVHKMWTKFRNELIQRGIAPTATMVKEAEEAIATIMRWKKL